MDGRLNGTIKRSIGLCNTRRTDSEQKYFVSFNDKPIGGCAFFLQSTTGKLKDTFALTAMKMMMMPLAGSFIQDPKRWVGDSVQPPFIYQKLEIPVDR